MSNAILGGLWGKALSLQKGRVRPPRDLDMDRIRKPVSPSRQR
jgi:hypothetical protein